LRTPLIALPHVKNTGIFRYKAAKGENMEDKRKLIAAIMGAVNAYIQTEQQTPSVAPTVTPRVEPQPKVSRWKIFGRRGSIKE